LSITALISADTGDGAAGCASGNHTCSGTIPALAPNPNSASSNASEAGIDASSCARMLANV
jgi:hypothetical protein